MSEFLFLSINWGFSLTKSFSSFTWCSMHDFKRLKVRCQGKDMVLRTVFYIVSIQVKLLHSAYSHCNIQIWYTSISSRVCACVCACDWMCNECDEFMCCSSFGLCGVCGMHAYVYHLHPAWICGMYGCLHVHVCVCVCGTRKCDMERYTGAEVRNLLSGSIQLHSNSWAYLRDGPLLNPEIASLIH